MSEQLPDLSARLTLDTSALDAAVRDVSRAVGRIADTMDAKGTEAGTRLADGVERGSAKGAFIGSAVAGGVDSALAAVTEFTSGSVDAFAQLEDATAAAGVLFGDQVGVIAQAAKDAGKNVGISQQQFIDSAAVFGTFGKAAGLQGPKLSGFATQLTQLAGDMASFKGTTPEQAIEAVGAALRGETEPIRAYGVMLDAATVAQEAQRIGLVKSVVDHTKVQSAKAALGTAQERLNKVMRDSKSTDAEKAAAQAAVARAQDQVTKAMAGTTPELTQQQKLLATQSAILRQTGAAQGDFARTSDSTANTQKRLAAESANAQAALGAKLAPAITLARLALLQLVTGLSGLIGWVQRNLDIIVPLAAAIGVFTLVLKAAAIQTTIMNAVTKIWTASQLLLNAVLTANPIGLVIAAIVALVAAFIIAYKKSETFRNIVQGAMAAIRTYIEGAMIVARAVVSAVMAFIQGNVSGRLAAVRAVVAAVFGFIASYIRAQINLARAVIAGVLNIIVGLFTGDFGRAKDGAVQALRGLLAFLRTIGGLIKSALGNLGGLLVQAGRDLVSGLISGIHDMGRAAGDALVGIAKGALDAAKSFLHIKSPSRRARDEIGAQIGAGVRDGILDSAAEAAAAGADLAAAAMAPAANMVGQVRIGATGAVSGAAVSLGAPQLVTLSRESIAALAASFPDQLLQLILDGRVLAEVVNERLGGDATSLARGGVG